MEVSSLLPGSSTFGSISLPPSVAALKYGKDELILRQLRTDQEEDQVDVSFGTLDKNLTITAQQIVEKLNELLKPVLPDGIASLKPEDTTPEATAERIVRGATAFFDVYAKQNPGLQGDELLNKFMQTIRGGIDAGYSDAYKTLEGLGAFQFEGVESGIQETKRLIEEKLQAYEAQKREDLGLGQPISSNTSNALLQQTGRNLVNAEQ